MKLVYVIAIPVVFFGSLLLFLNRHILFAEPYEYCISHPSAAEYWVEYTQGQRGVICHKRGSRTSIDVPGSKAALKYYGESCQLWQVSPRGLDKPFLIFDAPIGAYTMRRIVFEVDEPGLLKRSADFITVAEIQGTSDQHAIDAVFLDADGDGIEEIVECRREWLEDPHTHTFNNWAIRNVYHKARGEKFAPAYERLECCNSASMPLVRYSGSGRLR